MGLIFFLFVRTASATEINYICEPYGKSGAKTDSLQISERKNDKDPTAELKVTASVKKISIGKKTFKNILFKGTRPYTARGPIYLLESTPAHKVVKSIFISANPTGGDNLGADEVQTQDNVVHKMSCGVL